jgi:hypothetical protein
VNTGVVLPDVTDPDPPEIAIELTVLVSPVTESDLILLVTELAVAFIFTNPSLLPTAIPLEDIVAVPVPAVATHVNVG